MDPFILHLFVALAEKEGALIATRTKATLAAANGGAVVGELSMIAGAPRSASVTALRDAEGAVERNSSAPATRQQARLKQTVIAVEVD